MLISFFGSLTLRPVLSGPVCGGLRKHPKQAVQDLTGPIERTDPMLPDLIVRAPRPLI